MIEIPITIVLAVCLRVLHARVFVHFPSSERHLSFYQAGCVASLASFFEALVATRAMLRAFHAQIKMDDEQMDRGCLGNRVAARFYVSQHVRSVLPPDIEVRAGWLRSLGH